MKIWTQRLHTDGPLMKRLFAACLAGSLMVAPDIGAAQEQSQSEEPADDGSITLVPAIQGESNGFRALAVITADEKWLEKFENPGENGPEFELRPIVDIGKPARLLIFFAGAFPDNGQVNVLCKLRLSHDDEVVHEVDPVTCSEADDPGDVERLLLADTTLVITPTAEDAGKILKVEVGVTDGLRSEYVPLELSVAYGNAE